MEPESFFIVSEFGVGLAGFSAVVVALGYREETLDPVARFRVLCILVGALLPAFGALLPHLFSTLGFTGVSVWRWSSASLGAGLVAMVVDTELRRRRLAPAERAQVSPLLYATLLSVNAVAAIWQGANVTSTHPSPGPIFGGLLLLLANAAIVFIRVLVARPSGGAAG